MKYFRLNLRTRLLAAIFALALVASIATLTLAPRPGPASADGHGPKADVTFTKWLTDADFPTLPWDMTGIVGGDVGTGAYTGEVLSQVDNGTTWAIHATYNFNGGKHSLTADVQIIDTDATGVGVITGVVTNGWLKGSQVTGGFATLPVCDIATPGNINGTLCWKGTLHIGPKF